ncbi:MAG: AAA family ATPase [Desulfobacterales bacterium]|nr:AAA family ATPase [Desulfobacterales bacterium]
MLKKIEIKGLFNKFKYEIELKEEGITILTGPNGYGKTTILKIIYALATRNPAFFFQLPFTEIAVTQEKTEIRLSKTGHDTLEIQWGNEKPIIVNKQDEEIIRLIGSPPYSQVGENRWINARTGTFYTTDKLISQLIENNPEFIAKHFEKLMPDFVDVYLIREQRLIRKPVVRKRRWGFFDEDIQESFTIEEYAIELSENIKDILANSSKIGQELDSSFPRRLFDETASVTEQDFNTRYNAIREKQKLLSLYGLSATKEDSHTSFKEENAKTLLVYLNDTKKKLAVFDDILHKLEIFSSVLNERQFVSKHLEISPEFGFRFITEDGKELSLTDLSSGEQQEVVLMYELLFRVGPDTLVLIDEPEISLHVAWQKEVLNDLLKICELQKITVITATHSPQIIGTHWDLVVDLEEISKWA